MRAHAKCVTLHNVYVRSFRSGNFKRACEYYTSAIMARDDNHILYTNRAQAFMKLGKFYEASNDCKTAIKWKPDSIKAHVWLSRALRELGEFQEAIDVLERAEGMAEDQANVLKKDKIEIIEKQKKAALAKE